jgi:hypothetical protein
MGVFPPKACFWPTRISKPLILLSSLANCGTDMWQTLDFWFLGLSIHGREMESTIPDIKNVEKVFSGV